MIATPASETSTTSVYFDAPLAHFHMSSQDPEQPIDGTSDPDVNRNPSVAMARNPDVKDSPNVYNDDDVHNPNGVVDLNNSAGWLPAVDVPDTKPIRSRSVLKKPNTNPNPNPREHSPAPSTSSARDGSNGRAPSRAPSIGKRNMREGVPDPGSTFSNGAGTTGPNATAEQNINLHFRAASAEVSLTPKQKSKIAKSECEQSSPSISLVTFLIRLPGKDSKRLSKIIKQEAKTEKEAVTVAINELAELQKIQKAAVKVHHLLLFTTPIPAPNQLLPARSQSPHCP